MMTLTQLRNFVNSLLNVTMFANRVTVEDFIGFDADWVEQFQETDMEKLFEVLNTLPCIKEGMYPQYQLADAIVTIEFSSYDI